MTKLSVYPACFIQEENGYSVVFPDLNHLATCGETLDEAQRMAVDCLAGYLYTLQEDGEPIPPASPMEKIRPEEICAELEVPSEDAFVSAVVVDVAEYAKNHFGKFMTISLTLPSSLYGESLERELDCAQVLEEALQEKLRSA